MTKSIVGVIGCVLKVLYRIFVGGRCPTCKESEVNDETIQSKK